MIEPGKKIILLEHSASHQDILYSQVLFLQKSGFEPVLWLNEKLSFDSKVFQDNIYIRRFKYNNSNDRRKFIKEFKKYIKQYKIKNIVINTAQGIGARNIILKFLFSRIKITGILHEAERLYESFTQKIISKKIKKYFVLNDYIFDYCYKGKFKNISVESLYPFFIPYENKSNEFLINKLLICIPGEVSAERKNYKFLIDILAKNKDHLSQNINFILLGSPRNEEGRNVIKRISELKLNNIVHSYNDYVLEEEYLKRINQSDIIMPLIDQGTKYYKEYATSKITGAYTLAFSFHKPLLMHKSFANIDDFKQLAIFYDDKNFIDTINALAKDKSQLKEKTLKYNEMEKFSFEYQMKKYIKFLE